MSSVTSVDFIDLASFSPLFDKAALMKKMQADLLRRNQQGTLDLIGQ